MQSFEYRAPSTVEEVYQDLKAFGSDAKINCGRDCSDHHDETAPPPAELPDQPSLPFRD